MVTTHNGGTVRLLDLLDGEAPQFLDGHQFIGCELRGPVVLLVLEGCEFRGNAMQSTQFWVIDPGRAYEGGVGARRCVFDRCHFVDVGIAADRETVDSFFSS